MTVLTKDRLFAFPGSTGDSESSGTAPPECARYCENSYSRTGVPSAHQRRRLHLVRDLLSECRGKLLDFGCGFGDVAWSLKDSFEVTGVDVSGERVAWAREHFSPVRFERCDQTGLSFPDETFDTVLSSVVIHWTNDPDVYLREAFRVLKPEGQLVIVIQNEPVVNNLFRKWMGRPKAIQPFWNEPFYSMLHRLERHGFEIHSLRCFFESPREALRSVREAVKELVLIPCRIARVARFAPYYGIRAVKQTGMVCAGSVIREEELEAVL